jgi:integrase
VVLAELGLRNQEADALAWADVLDEHREPVDWRAEPAPARIFLHRAMKRGDGGAPIGINDLKVKHTARPLALSDVAVEALRRRRVEQAAERLGAGVAWTRDERWTDLVFTTEVGTPLHPSNVRRAFRAACRRAEVPELTPYEAGRHTNASLLVDGGATLMQVANQLGHRTTRMLERHYAHRVADEVTTAADVMNRRRNGPRPDCRRLPDWLPVPDWGHRRGRSPGRTASNQGFVGGHDGTRTRDLQRVMLAL